MDNSIEPQSNEQGLETQPKQPVQSEPITLDIHDAVMTQEQFFGDYLEKGLKDG